MKRVVSKNKTVNRELYKILYLIRAAEEAIRKRYAEDEMKTPMHLCIGAEAIATGVCYALGDKGQVLGSYRSHAIYLARAQETDKFFAELYGKVTGVARGKAGSMHLSSPAHGYLGSSAVVATPIPVAVGAAFVNKRKKNKKVVAVFFGDGAIDEGVFWESVNLACLMKLPIIFVCEDNGLAIHASSEIRHGYTSITDIIEKFDCVVFKNESATDTQQVYEMTKDAIASIHKTGKPVFMHLRYYRYLEHVGINEDFSAGYRPRKEFEKWMIKDPITLQRSKLLATGMREKNIIALEKKIDDQIMASIERARMAPFPKARELYQDIYA